MIRGQYGVVLVGTWWCWVSIIWYCLELSGTGLIWAFMPVYIEKVEIWLGVTIAGRTNEQTRNDRATQPLDHGSLR